MSTYFHHPKETETPAVKRDSHDYNPGYAVINFGDLSCFPSDVQVLQLRDALDEYISEWLTAKAPEVTLRSAIIAQAMSSIGVPTDSLLVPEDDEITVKYRGDK